MKKKVIVMRVERERERREERLFHITKEREREKNEKVGSESGKKNFVSRDERRVRKLKKRDERERGEIRIEEDEGRKDE